nr:J287 [uncultured bacterium]
MTNTTTHPTCQRVSVLNCVDDAHLAIGDIAGLAGLLRRAIAHGALPGVSELFAVSNAVLRNADRLDASLDLWRLLAADSLPSSHHRSMQRLVDAIRPPADGLGDAGMYADSGTPPAADHLAALADSLLALIEPLHQAVNAAWDARSAPPPADPLH